MRLNSLQVAADRPTAVAEGTCEGCDVGCQFKAEASGFRVKGHCTSIQTHYCDDGVNDVLTDLNPGIFGTDTMAQWKYPVL